MSQVPDTLSPVFDRLMNHPVYSAIIAPDDLKVFMEHHVFAVWDFMSLTKRLQRDLTNTDVPWLPPAHPHYARLINEIVLGEESDEDGHGGYLSHFDLYIKAMEEAHANTEPILSFINFLRQGIPPSAALKRCGVSQSVQSFVENTLILAQHAPTHAVAAAFFYGREDIIPHMFLKMVNQWSQQGIPVETFEYYLKRHIEIDGDRHGPWAEALLNSLCGVSDNFWSEAWMTASQVWTSRIALWDGVMEALAMPK